MSIAFRLLAFVIMLGCPLSDYPGCPGPTVLAAQADGKSATGKPAELPRLADSRLRIELFAEHPDVVTPTGLAVDGRGRVFVAESHTHFRPDDYPGPEVDRILLLVDANGDGRAEKPSVFHEGFRYVMDIEFHPDGSLYVATRSAIHRLRDTDGDDRADEITPIIQLDTQGTYPHNGLAGMAFEFEGNMHFGLGENSGAAYILRGTDGSSAQGGNEGGSTYAARGDGSRLQRTSTGYWNPFGMCVDGWGRVFTTDNDPDGRPPCRLIQVVEGGDYGYQYRYGRSGRHPLVCWNGELPGTLPMISGTGEAPAAIVAYDSDHFPAEYRGDLLVASWSDHHIERYGITHPADQGLVQALRQILVDGPQDFRPVGIDVAPDGSVYISDWVSSSYSLHRLGRVWRVRSTATTPRPPTGEATSDLSSADRLVRERAARQLMQSDAGRASLREQLLTAEQPSARMVSLQALIAADAVGDVFQSVAERDSSIPVRTLALKHYLQHGGNVGPWLTQPLPVVMQAEVLRHVVDFDPSRCVYLPTDDPVALQSLTQAPLSNSALAAIRRLGVSQPVGKDQSAAQQKPDAPAYWRLLTLLHERRQAPTLVRSESPGIVSFLQDESLPVRLAAVRWIADERGSVYREQLARMREQPQLPLPLFLAISAAMNDLDGKPPEDRPPPDVLLGIMADDSASSALRRHSLRLMDPRDKRISLEVLGELLKHPDPALRVEAARSLARHHHERRAKWLIDVATDPRQSLDVRVEAIGGLGSLAHPPVERLLDIAMHGDDSLQTTALRSLMGVSLTTEQKSRLGSHAFQHEAVYEAARRLVTDKPWERPAPEDVDGWLALLERGAKGDAQAGQRVFFDAQVGTCSRCHRVEGQGGDIGPDLSSIHRRLALDDDPQARRWLMQTILQPGRHMAPHYTPWQMVTKSGQTLIGLPRRKGAGKEVYLGLDGKEFEIADDEIETQQESTTSIMPAGLLQPLTVQELNDLFAFLMRRE